MKIDTALESSGLEAKILNAAELEQYASQIQALKYDAQHPGMNLHAEGTYGGHKDAIKQEIRDMGQAGSRDTVVAVFDGDKIVGFMSTERVSPTEAKAKEVWTKSSGRAQQQIFRKLIGKAKEHYTVKHVSHLRVNLENAPTTVAAASADSMARNFIRPTETAEVESPSILPDMPEHVEGVDDKVE